MLATGVPIRVRGPTAYTGTHSSAHASAHASAYTCANTSTHASTHSQCLRRYPHQYPRPRYPLQYPQRYPHQYPLQYTSLIFLLNLVATVPIRSNQLLGSTRRCLTAYSDAESAQNPADRRDWDGSSSTPMAP